MAAILEVEKRANELSKKQDYQAAWKAYTQCLRHVLSGEGRSRLLLARSSCALKLKRYEDVLADCKEVLKIFKGKHHKALSRQITALCGLGKLAEAQRLAREWKQQESDSALARRVVERLDTIEKSLADSNADEALLTMTEDIGEERTPPEGAEEAKQAVSPSAVAPSPGNVCAPGGHAKGRKRHDSSSLHCVYCKVTYKSKAELETHCRSDSHQALILSDEGRDWKHRPPPRGVCSTQFVLCQTFMSGGNCRLGEACCDAHSEEELDEWKERFEYRTMKMQGAKDRQLQGNCYMEQLLEKWVQAPVPDKVMAEKIDSVRVHANCDLAVTVATKRCTHQWLFTVTSKTKVERFALLNDVHRTHFYIVSINSGPKKSVRNYKLEPVCQEYINTAGQEAEEGGEYSYRMKVGFKTDIFGTFRQSIVFDVGSEPVLLQRLCVDVVPVADIDKLQQAKETVVCESKRWESSTMTIVPYSKTVTLTEQDQGILSFYPAPQASKFVVTQSVMEKALTKNNYTTRMHDLLYIEEMAQYSSIARYNVSTKLQIINRYLLMPSTVSTAKYAQGGELFARMKLIAEISEDTAAGRLLLNNVQTVVLAPLSPDGKPKDNKVYEVKVEDKGKSFIFLRQPPHAVTELGLRADTDLLAEVQFSLNRLPLCEMHHAVDKLPDMNMVFPDLRSLPSIPWTPSKYCEKKARSRRGSKVAVIPAEQWSDKLDSRLNAKQKEAIVAMTTAINHKLPPILLVGPFGTGKTFTLAQAIKQIAQQEGTRVLVCTHSNSAADLYIKDYLHSFVEQGLTEAKPLRVYYRQRWVQTVNPTVQRYCLVTEKGDGFNTPTKEDILKHRVIVVTLSTSRSLTDLGLDTDTFSHILIDEAAQALECQTIMPLALAGPGTRIVLAGDHMQLCPEVHSEFAMERNFHISLVERLFDFYPDVHPCKILLCENYRSHAAIITFASQVFYNNKLVASGNVEKHSNLHPLSFFCAMGQDVQDQNSTTFYNNAEVYEIVERVAELQKNWPKSWGRQDENSIGVVTPYADQVYRIRAELRKHRMFGVCVERVLNVQGKQFRAIFLSTVRTRHTCRIGSPYECDFGFLSNAKLLNTAITRAQSLVAVVGDPVSLCSVGKCRKLWMTFLELCEAAGSLHGMTWSSLRSQLDGVELRRTYTLNPLAPEFIPNRLRHGEPYIRINPYLQGPYSHHYYPYSAPWFPRQAHPAFQHHMYIPQYTYPPLRMPYVGAPIIIPPYPIAGYPVPPPSHPAASRYNKTRLALNGRGSLNGTAAVLPPNGRTPDGRGPKLEGRDERRDPSSRNPSGDKTAKTDGATKAKPERRDSGEHADGATKQKGQTAAAAATAAAASQMLGVSLMSSGPYGPIPPAGHHYPGSYAGAPGGYNARYAAPMLPLRAAQVSPSAYARGRVARAPSGEESVNSAPSSGIPSSSAGLHGSAAARLVSTATTSPTTNGIDHQEAGPNFLASPQAPRTTVAATTVTNGAVFPESQMNGIDPYLQSLDEVALDDGIGAEVGDGSGKSWPYPAHTIPSYKLHQEWYNHLLQTQGKEAAESYADQVRERARMYNSLHHRGRHDEMKAAWLHSDNNRRGGGGGGGAYPAGAFPNGYGRHDYGRHDDGRRGDAFGGPAPADFGGRLSPPHPENDFRSPWEQQHDDKDRVVRFIQESIDRELQGTSIDQLQQHLWEQWSSELHPRHPLYLRRLDDARYRRHQQMALQQHYAAAAAAAAAHHQREPDVFDTMAHFDQRAASDRRELLRGYGHHEAYARHLAFPLAPTLLPPSPSPLSHLVTGHAMQYAAAPPRVPLPASPPHEHDDEPLGGAATWAPLAPPTSDEAAAMEEPLTYAGALRKPPGVKSPVPAAARATPDDPLNLLKNLNIAPKSPDGSYQYFQ